MSTVEFNDRVAIVTGAGAGLGREHAKELGRRGVKVVVNDFGGARDGTGGSATPAEEVVNEIKAEGGEAMAAACSVTDYDAVQKMVQDAIDHWGHVDILVNNAGVLRDKTFHKMELADFDFVMDVHLMGSVNCTKAVWDHMRERGYGRIVMTTSTTGLFGNFGQTNYGAAKLGLVGFMNCLHQEGVGKGIHVNAVSPTAATRMTEDILPEAALKLYRPEAVTPAVVYLCSDNAPAKTIMAAGAGGFAVSKIVETGGIALPESDWSAEAIAARWDEITDPSEDRELANGGEQGQKMMGKVMALMQSA